MDKSVLEELPTPIREELQGRQSTKTASEGQLRSEEFEEEDEETEGEEDEEEEQESIRLHEAERKFLSPDATIDEQFARS